MTAPPREQCPKVAIGELCSCYSYGKGADYCPFAAPAPSAAQPAEPPATDADRLVHDLRAIAIDFAGDHQVDNTCRAAADLIERQAREIARLDTRNRELCFGWSFQNERAERAEADLRKANIDSANLLAECSDMSVDIEKYRGEIAALRMAVKDDAQWAQENERLTRERDEWKLKYGDANEWGLRHAAAWKERAERAEAAAKEANERAHNETERRLRAEAERDALRAVIERAANVMHGDGVMDQGQAWDECVRVLDAARAKVQL